MSAPLPEQHAQILADKLYDGQLALFVGAGISHLAKGTDGRRLPLWKGLAEQVAAACHEDMDSYRDLLELFDAIVYGQSRMTLEDAVRQALDDRDLELSDAHQALKDLPWAAVLSTNYDGLLARLLVAEPVYEEQDYDRFTLAPDRQPRLFQIHGTLARQHTLTRDDYRLWPEKHPRAFRHLEDIVLNKTMLFVGYSLSDPHLDSVLATVKKITAGREKRLYAWMWQLSPNQKNLLDRRDKIEAICIEKEEDWEHAFRQVAACLDKRRCGASAPPAAVAADAFAYARAQYLAGLNAHYGVANLLGLYQWGAGYARDDVLLDEVFVKPDLERTERRARAREGAVGETEALERPGLTVAMRARRREEQAPSASRTPAFQVLAQERRVLIVGAPGQGKSTLLRAWLLSAAAQWREQPALHPLPVLIRLAEWEADPQRGEGWLREHVRSKVPRLAEVGSAAVDAWLKGPVLWLLDGIDEVRDPHERGRLLEEVRATVAMRPQDRWAITTRPAGEPAGGIGSDWLRCELPSLSDPQVEQVLARWAGVLQRKEQLELDHRQMARTLKADLGLRLMRGNGLLLTMAVLFYKSRKRLPLDRWDFYDASEQALRDSWVRHRLQQAQRYLPGDYLPELLEALALKGMVEGSVLFADEDVKKEADSLLLARGYSGRERDQEIARLLEAARDLIGVLVEQGPGRFGFLHLTFQEFYAARALVNCSQEAADYIRRYWDHPDWHEVWPLYRLGVQADPARTAELFQTILADAHPLDQYLFRPQLACLRLLGTGSAPVRPPETGVLDWARSIIEQAARPFQEVCTIVQRWERPPGAELREALLGRLADKDSMMQGAVARALAAAVNEPAVRAALLGRLADEDSNVRWAVVQALAAAVNEPAVRAALLARLADEDSNVRESNCVGCQACAAS